MITSPVRFEIIEAMRDLAPCGIKAIAQRLGVRPDTLYRHMELLQQFEFVVPAGFRKVSRATEQLFDLTADDFNISFDSDAEPAAANEMMCQTANVFLKRVMKVVQRTAAARAFDTTPEGKNANILCDYAHLTPAEFRQLSGLLRKVKEMLDGTRGRPTTSDMALYNVLLTAIPVVNAPAPTEENENTPEQKPLMAPAMRRRD